jgi:hypothetical protein
VYGKIESLCEFLKLVSKFKDSLFCYVARYNFVV